MNQRCISSSLLRGAMRTSLALGLAAPLVLWACTEDDGGSAVPQATPEAGVATPDAGESPSGDAGGAPPRVLIVQGKPRGSELAVVNIQTKVVDGRMSFQGGYGATSTIGGHPYLLDGENDRVYRLDAAEPWRAVASWDVRGDDAFDGALPNANPIAVVQTGPDKAYVLRYNRDRIAVIAPGEAVDGGAALRWIDLAPLKQAGDPDSVEPTSAVYVPSKKRVYVLLGNADLTRYVTTDVTTKLVCAELAPSIVAIDVETDTLVDLGGKGPGGGIALEGYNPPQGSPLVYDEAGNRLLVLQAGCNAALGDGGAGDMTRRRVEEVDLGTGAVKTLLSLDDRGFPSSLAYASAEHAAVAFYFDGYHWDPRQASLGAAVHGGVDLVAPDGRGAFVGSRQIYLEDGGTGPLQVLAIPVGDAGPTVIAEDPFTEPGGYVAGIEAWPRP